MWALYGNMYWSHSNEFKLIALFNSHSKAVNYINESKLKKPGPDRDRIFKCGTLLECCNEYYIFPVGDVFNIPVDP